MICRTTFRIFHHNFLLNRNEHKVDDMNPPTFVFLKKKNKKHYTHIVVSSFQVGSLSRTASVRYFCLPMPKITDALHTPERLQHDIKLTTWKPSRKGLALITEDTSTYLLLSLVVNFELRKLRKKSEYLLHCPWLEIRFNSETMSYQQLSLPQDPW